MDYSPEVLRRFDSPTPARAARSAGDGIFAAEAEDRSLNVWVRFEVELRGDTAGGEAIGDVRYQVFGCPHTIAAADRAAEWLRGRRVAALRELDIAGIGTELAVPKEKLGKLLRIEDALAACADRIGVPAPADEEG